MAHDKLKSTLATTLLRELGAKAVRIMDGDVEAILNSGEHVRIKVERA